MTGNLTSCTLGRRDRDADVHRTAQRAEARHELHHDVEHEDVDGGRARETSGGVGASDHGREHGSEHGTEALDACTRVKSVVPLA